MYFSLIFWTQKQVHFGIHFGFDTFPKSIFGTIGPPIPHSQFFMQLFWVKRILCGLLASFLLPFVFLSSPSVQVSFNLGRRTPEGITIYLNLLEFTGIYWNLLELNGICWNLQEFARIYWNLLQFTGICQPRGWPPKHGWRSTICLNLLATALATKPWLTKHYLATKPRLGLRLGT